MAYARPRTPPTPNANIAAPAAIATGAGAATQTGLGLVLSRIFGALGSGFSLGQIIGAGGTPGGQPTPAQAQAELPGTVSQAPSITTPPPEPGGGKKGGRGRTAAKVGAGVVGAEVVTGGGLFSTIGDAINSVEDFLKLAAWLFHPRNWLRLAEFMTGLTLMGMGFYLLTRGARGAGRTTSHPVMRALSVTPAGRVIRVRQGRRMGRHEGQREAARMEARQSETRSQRQASAVEREKINLDARAAARRQNS